MDVLRKLPKIDKLIADKNFNSLNKKIITKIAQNEVALLRTSIQKGDEVVIDEQSIIENILKQYKQLTSSSLRPLINATGIILHTNLGRAPLHVKTFHQAQKIACTYSNLEYDIKKGKRGERYSHVTKQLQQLFGVEDALVVNNNAAAVFLVLNTFANNQEVIVSRGELVEIGGSFRIPDVMKNSGCKLVEIGTTNRTKIKDYENAINTNTALLMKVHQSNFSMQGFIQETAYEDIVQLASTNNLIDFYDAGGAYVEELPLPLNDTKLHLANILAASPSLVSFSGDKLLGGVQAGIIVGKKELISKLKHNQLLRMLRVDKVTLALLESTLIAHLEENMEQIPALHLLYLPIEKVKQKATYVYDKIQNNKIQIIPTQTYVGGGTMPNKTLPSYALHVKKDAQKCERLFREKDVIGRIEKDKFLLDFRSILEEQLDELVKTIKSIV